VTSESQGWFSSRFARLSTGLKMLLILGLALFPIGLVAIVASIQSFQQNNAERRQATLTRLEVKAQRLNAAFSRSALTISAAGAAISSAEPGSQVCEQTLGRLEQGVPGTRHALYSGSRLACATPGFAAPAAPVRRSGEGNVARLGEGGVVRLFVFSKGGRLEGIAEYPRALLTDITYIPGTSPDFDLDLVQGGRQVVLRDQFTGGALRQTVEGVEPVADGQMQLRIRLSSIPITIADVLLILLPVLMWIAAAAIGWLIAERLLLRPLSRIQGAVAAYRPGDRELHLPPLSTPAREISDLGSAFGEMVRTVARHESELEEAVERQKKLVREVHHRVKNNLQVVASLLNIHSRGATDEAVAAAYASIQRRVDALAVVHRNHYAELEESRGVALKPLISELSANLRATAPASASGLVIRLDLRPCHSTQDVAVSVAFLITEIIEYTILCGASMVTISLDTGDGTSGTAELTVESESLAGVASCEPAVTERFERIVTGLSRQLRSTIRRDQEAGAYALDIMIADAEA
jgi:two-component sensor histidine kinase